jgi:hypothetical protein
MEICSYFLDVAQENIGRVEAHSSSHSYMCSTCDGHCDSWHIFLPCGGQRNEALIKPNATCGWPDLTYSNPGVTSQMDSEEAVNTTDSILVAGRAALADGRQSAHGAEEDEGVSATQTSQDEQSQDEQSLSASTIQGTSTDTSRMEEIEVAKLRLQERRKRLLELQHVDEEEDRLNRELESIKEQQRERQGGS